MATARLAGLGPARQPPPSGARSQGPAPGVRLASSPSPRFARSSTPFLARALAPPLPLLRRQRAEREGLAAGSLGRLPRLARRHLTQQATYAEDRWRIGARGSARCQTCRARVARARLMSPAGSGVFRHRPRALRSGPPQPSRRLGGLDRRRRPRPRRARRWLRYQHLGPAVPGGRLPGARRNPTRGWPSLRAAEESRSRYRSSRSGTLPAVHSTRSSPGRPGIGWTRLPERSRRLRRSAPTGGWRSSGTRFRPPPDLGKVFASVYGRVQTGLPFNPWARPALDRCLAVCAKAAEGMRQAGVFDNPEQ